MVLRQFVDEQKRGYRSERFPNAKILQDFGARFEDRFGNPPANDLMTQFRSLANDTLGADDAVFPTQASFTLSHERMITGEISDNGAGDFLAAILLAGRPSQVPRAATLIEELLQSDTDPWSTIAWPLLDLADEKDASLGPVGQIRADRVARMLQVDDGGFIEAPTLRMLRARFDQLAEYEQAYGSKLTTLRRLVLFGVFSLHVHMIRRCHDVIPDGQVPPILLDLFDGTRRSLREAAAGSLQGGFRAIERLVVHRIRQRLTRISGGDAATFLETLAPGPFVELLRLESDAHKENSQPLDALAEAYWKLGNSGVGPGGDKGLPWNSLLALGRRAGYLLPYDNRGRGGKEHKRYGANAEFAEVLVATTVAPGYPLEYDEFLDRLRESFGIVVGRVSDYESIRSNDLRVGATLGHSISVNEGDLRANVAAFRDLIVDIGFARSYADGRTVVTTDEVAA